MKKATLLFLFSFCFIFNMIAGEKWKTFTSQDYITGITIDSAQNIWVTTSGGFKKFNGNSWYHYDRENTRMLYLRTNCVKEYKNNIIYIGTYNGLIKYNTLNHNFQFFDKINSNLGNNVINCIDIDTNGLKYICTNSGLYTFNDTTFTKITSIPNGIVNFCKIDNNNNKWICAGSIYKIQGSNTIQMPTSGISLDFDLNGNVWVASSTNGIYSFDGFIWTNYNTSNSNLISNKTSRILVDSLNNKWIGTNMGLVKLSGTTWTNYNESNSNLSNNFITYLFRKNSTLWIGTLEGICKMNLNNFSVVNNLNTNSSIKSNIISCISKDSNNNIWIGTSWNGVSKYNLTNNLWTSYSSKNTPSFLNDSINTISVNNNGVVFIGTRNGIMKFDGTSWTAITTANGLTNNFINAIKFDNLNKIYVGTNNGVNIYDGVSWSNISILNNYIVKSIYFDNIYGRQWYGLNNALFSFNGVTWTNNSSYPGVSSIEMTQNGTLWFGSNNKITKLVNTTYTPYTTITGLSTIGDVKKIAKDTGNSINIASLGLNGIINFDGISAWKYQDTSNSLILDSYTTDVLLSSNEKYFSTYMGLNRITNCTSYLNNLITPNGIQNTCSKDSLIVFFNNNNNNLKYYWFYNGSYLISDSNYFIKPKVSGEYKLFVKDTNNCVISSPALNLTITPSYNVLTSLVSADTLICPGKIASFNAVIPAAWSGGPVQTKIYKNSTLYSNLNGLMSGIYSNLFSTTIPGNYFLITSWGYCVDTSNVVSIVNLPKPNASITPSGTYTICNGDTLTIIAQQNNQYIYNWLFNNSSIMTGNGNYYYNTNQGGIYKLIVTNNFNCKDTSAILNLSVIQPPITPIVTKSNDTLFTQYNIQLTYQWYLNGNVINGATNYWHIPLTNGVYKVSVNNSYCINNIYSNDFSFNNLNIDNNQLNKIHLFPNPVKDFLYISNLKKDYTVKVYNVLNQLIYETNENKIDLSNLTNGIYLVVIKNPNNEIIDIQKITKQ